MKKITTKNLRQGQTIYMVVDDFIKNPRKIAFKVKSYMLYSQKVELPQEGYIIKKMPVDYVRHIASHKHVKRFLFYSRRKANSLVKMLNR